MFLSHSESLFRSVANPSFKSKDSFCTYNNKSFTLVAALFEPPSDKSVVLLLMSGVKKEEVKLDIESNSDDEFGSIKSEENEEEEEEEEEDDEENHEDIDNPLIPDMANNDQITGSQLAAIRNFTGNDTDDVELWIAHVARILTAFGWDGARTSQVAQNKLTDKAAKWLEAQKDLGNAFATWDNLKEGLLTRFKRETSDVTAALAVCELQQGGTESVADFYDRCVLTMKKKNHRVTDQMRQAADWKQAQLTDLFVFFGGGLKKYIRNATICSSNPPETTAALLSAAKRVEMQAEAKDKLFELETVDESDQYYRDLINEKRELTESNFFDRIDEMAEELAALRTHRAGKGRGRGKRLGRGFFQNRMATQPTIRTDEQNLTSGRGAWPNVRQPPSRDFNCWICGRRGHMSRNCTTKTVRNPNYQRRNEVRAASAPPVEWESPAEDSDWDIPHEEPQATPSISEGKSGN